jgi:transglutaminase-like putative cysteine protease
MRRTVSATLELEIREPAEIALQIAVTAGERVDEHLDIQLDSTPTASLEVAGAHGGRAHVLETEPGHLVVKYTATVIGRADPLLCSDDERLVYLRPSRYAESDRLAEVAARQFGGLSGAESILAGVSSWVGGTIGYEAGSSLPTHGAVDTLLGGRGVCRDFAHLVVALLRARDVPARVAAVYAPGLAPMDFHAVAEALVDGIWRVVDATLLAPRSSLIRIATGRDAADTAFLTVIGGTVDLVGIDIGAVIEDAALPSDDPRTLVSLG